MSRATFNGNDCDALLLRRCMHQWMMFMCARANRSSTAVLRQSYSIVVLRRFFRVWMENVLKSHSATISSTRRAGVAPVSDQSTLALLEEEVQQMSARVLATELVASRLFAHNNMFYVADDVVGDVNLSKRPNTDGGCGETAEERSAIASSMPRSSVHHRMLAMSHATDEMDDDFLISMSSEFDAQDENDVTSSAASVARPHALLTSDFRSSVVSSRRRRARGSGSDRSVAKKDDVSYTGSGYQHALKSQVALLREGMRMLRLRGVSCCMHVSAFRNAHDYIMANYPQLLNPACVDEGIATNISLEAFQWACLRVLAHARISSGARPKRDRAEATASYSSQEALDAFHLESLSIRQREVVAEHIREVIAVWNLVEPHFCQCDESVMQVGGYEILRIMPSISRALEADAHARTQELLDEDGNGARGTESQPSSSLGERGQRSDALGPHSQGTPPPSTVQRGPGNQSPAHAPRREAASVQQQTAATPQSRRLSADVGHEALVPRRPPPRSRWRHTRQHPPRVPFLRFANGQSVPNAQVIDHANG